MTLRSRKFLVGRRLGALAALTLFVGVSGCGNGLYPVTGRVEFEDGTSLDEGMVICEMKDGGTVVMARGTIKQGGTFQLGTRNPGDGALPGKYRVLVVPPSLPESLASKRPPILDRKFE